MKKRKLNCRLIVSDFDGTLANSENEVSEENIKAINGYVSDGGIFAVCTGRILPSILPRVRAIGLKGLVIACQGSVIADIASGEIIRNSKLNALQTAEICKKMEDIGANVQVFTDEGFYTDIPAEAEHLKLYEQITGIEAKHTDGEPVSAFCARNNISCQKVATLIPYEEQAALFEKLTAAFGGEYEVTCSAKVLIEIIPIGEDKGTALKFLAKHYNIPAGKVCAMGDNLNDLPMLKAADYGVAVGNCSPLLRDKVSLFTVSNDDNAVAEVIKKYGYAQDE